MMKRTNLFKLWLLLLCAVGANAAWADEVTFTAGTDKGETSVTKNPITVAMSTMSRDDNYRTYANSDMTVSAAGGATITKVEVTCTASGTNNYGPGKFSGTGYSYSGTVGTWNGSATSVTLSASAQVRMTKIVVTYTPAAPKYALTFTAASAGGTIAVTKSAAAVASGDEFEAGTVLDIVATPASGYDFTSWSASAGTLGSATSATTTLTMPAEAVTLTATFTAQTIVSDIVLDDVTNGTIAADKTSANVGETVTLTATPDEGYALKSWTVYDDNRDEVAVTPTGENTATFTMPTSDVLVSATFAAKHTINYYVAGQLAGTVTRVDGSEFNLDAAAPLGGKAFAGWSTANDAASPAFVDNSTAVTADMTVYAIFVKEAGMNGYYLVEADQADWRGDYLIAYSNEVFADGREGGTDGMGKQNAKATPGDKLSGKVVNRIWGDTYNVTITAIDDENLSAGYLMQTKDGMYNYQTSNNNGLSSTENKATAANYPLSVTFNSSSNIAIAISAGAVFHYNSNGYFRFYKDGGQKAVYLYQKIVTDDTYTLGLPETVTVTAAGYATYVSEYDLDYTDVTGLEAFRATIDGNTVKFNKVTKVPAGEGVLLKGDADDYEVPLAADAAAIENDFIAGTGAAVASEADGKYNFILNVVGGQVGFYAANGQTVAANRAYLQTTTAPASARLQMVFGDETTGIESLAPAIAEGEGVIVDLQGRRVARPTKGLYIVNGKKAIFK